MRLAGLGAVALDGYSLFQLIDSLLRDLSVDLCQISARMLEFRVKQFLDQFAVIGEEQGPLAVVIETAGSINACGEAEFV